jgi:hypothetical protein
VAYAQTAYGDIVPQLFIQFGAPNPASAARSAIGSLWKVAYALDEATVGDLALGRLDNPLPADAWAPRSSIGDRVDDIMFSRMRYWEGVASDNFGTNFLLKLKHRTPVQAQVAMGLAISLQAQEQAVFASHANVKKLAQETMNALEQIIGIGVGDDSAAIVAIDVAFAAAAVLTAVPTDGLSIAGAVGLSSATKSFMETSLNGAGEYSADRIRKETAIEKLELGGVTVHAVINKLLAAAEGCTTARGWPRRPSPAISTRCA